MKANDHTNLTTLELSLLNPQVMLNIAPVKGELPICDLVFVGDQYCPEIETEYLMDFITSDDNFVAAAREVKNRAFNPSGSEHGIVKKVCDMFINNPDLRRIIRQDLLQGFYYPEKIVSNDTFMSKYGALPRGFKYTANQIVQTMIVSAVKTSRICNCMMPGIWGETHNPGVSEMMEHVDHVRAGGFKYWFSLKLKSFLDNIPHDRLMQKIDILFHDKRVAGLACTLLGVHTSATGGCQTRHVGIPKDSPLADMLANELYLSELDQKIDRLELPHVRYDDQIVVFCNDYAAAEQSKGTLVAFVKNEMKCPVDYNRTRIKDIAHLAFLGLNLKRGHWCIQDNVKDTAACDYLNAVIAYTKHTDNSLLWEAYWKLTKFISFYEGTCGLENEIQDLKKWRDEHFTNAIAMVEQSKQGLVLL